MQRYLEGDKSEESEEVEAPYLVDTDKAHPRTEAGHLDEEADPGSQDTTVDKEEKPTRRGIALIEVTPKPEWTICTKTETGRELWWLRFSVTGLRPRRYGPFRSQSVALLVLDDMIYALGDAMGGEFDDIVSRDLVQDRCAKRWPQGTIEDEMMEQEA